MRGSNWSGRSRRAIRIAGLSSTSAQRLVLSRTRASITGATMTLSADALALLDALPEPAHILRAGGLVEHANRPALLRFGRDIMGSDLAALCQDPASFRSF